MCSLVEASVLVQAGYKVHKSMGAASLDRERPWRYVFGVNQACHSKSTGSAWLKFGPGCTAHACCIHKSVGACADTTSNDTGLRRKQQPHV